MEYRNLGRTGERVSLLSLGCMRLPDDDEEGAKVVSRAVDLGINYFETSEGYCGGRSEIKVGMGVKGRRDQVLLSTKSAVRPGTTADDLRRKVEVSLEKLGTERVDFYQLWDFKWPDFETVTDKDGGLDTLEKMRDEGLIRHIGVTSHETNEHIIGLLNTGRLESVTLEYNMLTRDKEPVIEYACEHGIAVVIMKPLAGGLLATPSEIIEELVPGQHPSAAAAALRFLMSDPRISTIPSGMTSVSEVEQNVETWESFTPLNSEEMEKLTAALDEYNALGKKFCTACNYCMPCPHGVRIPRLFMIRNYDKIFGLHDWARRAYAGMKPEGLPDNCIECGECEEKCPSGIPIIEHLKEVAEMFKGVRT